MVYFGFKESPLGQILLVATDRALCGVHFVGEKYYPRISASWRENPEVLPIRAAAGQLQEYFAGARRQFDVFIEPEGTKFQRDVWKALLRVPYGTTATYGEIARQLGKPQACRAVGSANSRNPISIIIPCHRVIGADRSLTGYAGGIERKRSLLALESGGAFCDLSADAPWRNSA